jgi:D-alanyl-D-alanine carboxypeptidase
VDLDRLVERAMGEWAVPGLALAVTDREGSLKESVYGLADLAARTPVTEDTLLQIGSISQKQVNHAV